MVLRDDFLKKRLKGKKVLDLGFVGSDISTKGHNYIFSSLHRLIITHASYVVGVDVQKEAVEKANKLMLRNNYYIHDDVVKLEKLERKTYTQYFDVIVAGEIIEHMANPAQFLEKIQEFLKDDGIIIITTPNYLSLRNMKNFVLTGREAGAWANKEEESKYGHVVGFTKLLLDNMFSRLGMDVVDFEYIFKNKEKNLSFRIERAVTQKIPRLRPNLCYIARKKSI